MADVFISYKRRLRPRIVEFATALEQLKVSVWFDAEIEPGKSFGAVINRELADARCVLVCWTPDAFAPEHGDEISWVEAEATKGRERKILVPVLLEQTMLNAPWNMLQTENLVAWVPGAVPTGAWLGVLAGIGKYVDRPGLADYVRAGGSAEDLTRWAQAYPSDPLAADVWERITELEIAAAKARVAASRTTGQPPPVAAPPPQYTPPPQPQPALRAPVQQQAAETPRPQPTPQPAAAASTAPASSTTSKPWRGWALALLIIGGLYLAYGVLSIFAGQATYADALVNLVIGAAILFGANFVRNKQK